MDSASLSGSFAPITPSYLVLGNDATLSAERVLTAGTGISFADTGANGTLTISLDTSYADGRYVNVTGDTMTGGLIITGATTFFSLISDLSTAITLKTTDTITRFTIDLSARTMTSYLTTTFGAPVIIDAGAANPVFSIVNTPTTMLSYNSDGTNPAFTIRAKTFVINTAAGGTIFSLNTSTSSLSFSADIVWSANTFQIGTSGDMISIVNLLDKSATESVSGAWTFTNNFTVNQLSSGGVSIFLSDSPAGFILKNWNSTIFFTADTENNPTTVSLPNSTMLSVSGTITGSSTIQGTRFISTISTGTSPYSCSSTTLNTNLNADLLDGKNTGTSGNVIGLLDGNKTDSGNNTWSGTQQFDGAITIDLTSTTALVVRKDSAGGNVLVVDTSGSIITITGSVTISSTLGVTGLITATGNISTAKITNLTTNGFVKTGSGDGTLSVDTTNYVSNVSGTSPIVSSGGATPAISLDLTVAYNWTGAHTFNADTILDLTSTTAFKVRKDSAGGDILTIDTSSTNPLVLIDSAGTQNALFGIGGTPTIPLHILSFQGKNTLINATATRAGGVGSSLIGIDFAITHTKTGNGGAGNAIYNGSFIVSNATSGTYNALNATITASALTSGGIRGGFINIQTGGDSTATIGYSIGLGRNATPAAQSGSAGDMVGLMVHYVSGATTGTMYGFRMIAGATVPTTAIALNTIGDYLPVTTAVDDIGSSTFEFDFGFFNSDVRMRSLILDGDVGSGTASTIKLTNVSAAVSGVTPAVLATTGGGPTGATQSRWVKYYDGTTVCYLAGWT